LVKTICGWRRNKLLLHSNVTVISKVKFNTFFTLQISGNLQWKSLVQIFSTYGMFIHYYKLSLNTIESNNSETAPVNLTENFESRVKIVVE